MAWKGSFTELWLRLQSNARECSDPEYAIIRFYNDSSYCLICYSELTKLIDDSLGKPFRIVVCPNMRELKALSRTPQFNLLPEDKDACDPPTT